MEITKREYYRQYRKKNADKIRSIREKFKKSHPDYIAPCFKLNPNYFRDNADENRTKINLQQKIRRENNKIKYLEDAKKDRIKNKEKYLSRLRAYKKSLRGLYCKFCGETSNLEFHHINYDKDIGITVCTKCHGRLHRGNKK